MAFYDVPESITLLGSYASLALLEESQPTGSFGQVFTVSGKYYGWSRDSLSWVLLPFQEVENKLVNLSLTTLENPFITGLKLKADIVLGELILNTIDSSGVVWIASDIDGWWRLPEVESQDLPRGWGDGSYDAKGRYANRLITLNGSFLTQSPSQVVQARDKLVRAIDLVYKGGYLIVREDPDKSSWVRLSGTPSIQNVSARGRTNFSIGLKAVDPIKYELVDNDVNALNEQLVSMGGSVSITNQGNTRVPLLIEIVGGLTASPAAPVRISQTSNSPEKVITIVESQGSADRLNIDTYNREVLFNDQGYEAGLGASRRRLSTLVDWFDLEPGVNSFSFTGTGAANCSIQYRSGWIG